MNSSQYQHQRRRRCAIITLTTFAVGTLLLLSQINNEPLSPLLRTSHRRKLDTTIITSSNQNERSLFLGIELQRTEIKLPFAIEYNLVDWNAPPVNNNEGQDVESAGEVNGARDVPLFWHILKSGGTTVKLMYAQCYRLVEACETGELIDIEQQQHRLQLGGRQLIQGEFQQQQPIEGQVVAEELSPEQENLRLQELKFGGSSHEETKNIAENIEQKQAGIQQQQQSGGIDEVQQQPHQPQANEGVPEQPPSPQENTPSPQEVLQQQQQAPQPQQPIQPSSEVIQPEQRQQQQPTPQDQASHINSQSQPQVGVWAEQHGENRVWRRQAAQVQQQQRLEVKQIPIQQNEGIPTEQQQSQSIAQQQPQQWQQWSDTNTQNIPGQSPLRIVIAEDGRKYVNVDVTTPEGIIKASQLGFASSGLADVVFTPLFVESSALLFDGGNGHKGRMFAVFRHPVERVVRYCRLV
jgi:hypothetical protein